MFLEECIMKILMILALAGAGLLGAGAWTGDEPAAPVALLPLDREGLLEILDRISSWERPDPWILPFACGRHPADAGEVLHGCPA